MFTILKAFAYDRSGNAHDAAPLIQHVIDCKTVSAESIHHAATLLQQNGDFDKLLELYTKAVPRQPQDIALQQQLFLAHVRLFQPVKQQQVRPTPGMQLACCDDSQALLVSKHLAHTVMNRLQL